MVLGNVSLVVTRVTSVQIKVRGRYYKVDVPLAPTSNEFKQYFTCQIHFGKLTKTTYSESQRKVRRSTRGNLFFIEGL